MTAQSAHSIPTVSVVARHAAGCPHKDKGPTYEKCRCRKSLAVYQNGKSFYVSCKTRTWSLAVDAKEKYLADFDPKEIELNKLRAKAAKADKPIDDAIASYLVALHGRRNSSYSVDNAKQLLQTRFLNFLNAMTPRPMLLSEIDVDTLTNFRGSWTTLNDNTAAQRWVELKSFFYFAERRGWLSDNPTNKLDSLKVKKGNRTAIFKDEQYDKILDAIKQHEPAAHIPEMNQKNWQRRLLTFVELLRWSGMDLVDAVQFRPELVDAQGVLTYRRQKTGMLAGPIPLPADLVALLRNIPLEQGSVAEMPFRTKGIVPKSDTRKWQHRLDDLFVLAGITEVRTDIRTRRPHAKMFRDTFAVWNLAHFVSLRVVSKMLGHANTVITEAHYLPFVEELKTAQVTEVRKALASLKPRTRTAAKVLNIAAGR